MSEKVLAGIGFAALCAMFYCMGLVIESHSAICAILPAIGVVVTAATAIYASNCIEYDDEEE